MRKSPFSTAVGKAVPLSSSWVRLCTTSECALTHLTTSPKAELLTASLGLGWQQVTGMTFAQPHYITVPWKAFVSQLIYEEARIRQVLEVARAHPVIKTIHGPDPSDEDTGPS